MPILKFIKNHSDGSRLETVIQCPHYEVYRHNETVATVVAYPGYTTEGGVERYITRKRDEGFDVCYVENDNGKTVDRISAVETSTTTEPA